MKRISKSAIFLIGGLMWLASVSGAEAATLVGFSNEEACRPHQLPWMIFSPAGMGIVDLGLNLLSTDECEEDLVAVQDGGSGGGGFGGVSGGFPSGGAPVSAFLPDALGSEGEFALTPELFDSSEFPGDDFGDSLNPAGPDGGNGVTFTFNGGNVVLSLDGPLGDDDSGSPRFDVTGPQNFDDPNLTVVPEPGSFMLLGTGLALAVRRLRRR